MVAAATVILLLIGVSLYAVAVRIVVPRPEHLLSNIKRTPSKPTPANAAVTQRPSEHARPVTSPIAPIQHHAEQVTHLLPVPMHSEPAALPDPAETVVAGSGQSVRDSLVDGQPCPDCPQMVVVPVGSFTMGSWVGEEGHDGDESPSHPVTIKQPFALGRFAVTRGEFAAFVKATGYHSKHSCYAWNLADWTPKSSLSWRSPGFAQSDRDPVVCVSWIDAQAYVAWLRAKTGRPYRLPSEAEWEYAARAGAQTRYFFGEDERKFCRYGNGADRSLTAIAPPEPVLTCSDGYAFTAPAGLYRPNGFGLYDMLGNAWQWVADCVHRDYKNAPRDGSAWIDESGDCTRRVGRGGSWLRSADRLRSASRLWSKASDRWFDWGFRVARAVRP